MSTAVPPTPPNAKLIADLELLLKQMIDEHRKLLKQVEQQHDAMRHLDRKLIDETTKLQEGSRTRIAALETRRRLVVLQIARGLKLNGEPKIPALAEHFPQRKLALLSLRDQLRQLVKEISTKNQIAGRLANAVLGHLNTALRLVAGAVEQAGLYTKRGLPQLQARVSRLETIG